MPTISTQTDNEIDVIDFFNTKFNIDITEFNKPNEKQDILNTSLNELNMEGWIPLEEKVLDLSLFVIRGGGDKNDTTLTGPPQLHELNRITELMQGSFGRILIALLEMAWDREKDINEY